MGPDTSILRIRAAALLGPLKRVLPSTAALVGTFVFCGALHDLVATAVRGSMAFFFTPWFFFLGLGVVH
jgi:hypothetical protein